MPVVTIAGNPNISDDERRKMVHEVSKIVAETYGLPIETITVLVQEYPPENIGAGGELLIDRFKK
ncbi:MAG: tautomerase family protein [Methanobrevibacter sp.]|nr:tautomerase family protein [Methanobrevibacter sp.]